MELTWKRLGMLGLSGRGNAVYFLTQLIDVSECEFLFDEKMSNLSL